MGSQGRVATILLTPEFMRELGSGPSSIGRRVLRRLRDLERFPEMGAPVLAEGLEDWRQLLVEPYRIGYRYDREAHGVYVLRLQHVRQAWPPE